MKNLLKILPLFLIGCISIFLCGILFLGCDSQSDPVESSPEPNIRKDIELSGATRTAAENLNRFYTGFTADMIEYVDNNDNIIDKNVVVSPLSVSMALGILANGIDQTHSDLITDYLGIKELTGMNSLSATLLAELPKADNQTKMSIANAMWVNDAYSLNANFRNILADYYDASPEYGDFRNKGESVKNKINKWCSDKTEGLIPQIIDFVSDSHYAIILDALYFKGKWSDSPFSKENTAEADFHGYSGTTKVNMMHAGHKERLYASDTNFKAFSIPFGNGSFSFMVVVPEENVSREDAVRLLTPETLESLKDRLSYTDLEIFLPKFKCECNFILSEAFRNGKLAGINNAMQFTMFDPEFTATPLIRHASSVEIDESGAEAAAATIVDIYTSAPAGSTPQKYTVTVDRPFFFFINEKSTGACLLSGRIAEL